MHIKTIEEEQAKKHHFHFGKKLRASLLLAAVSLAGFATWAVVQAATQAGDTVTIIKKNIGTNSDNDLLYGVNPGNGGPWSTHWYQVRDANNVVHDAVCIEPSKSQPMGSSSVSIINSDDMKRALLATIESYSGSGSGSPVNYYTGFGNSYSWNTSGIRNLLQKDTGNNTSYDYTQHPTTVELRYILGHAMAGGAYGGSDAYYALETNGKARVQQIQSDINTWFSNSNYNGNLADFTLFTAKTSDSDAQRVAWLEYIPVNVQAYVKIKKVDSATGTVSNGPVSVVGTVFSILNSSNVEVGTITIGNDGTGTSPALGKGTYTIKEKTVTVGYNLNSTAITVTIDTSDNGRTIDLTQNNATCTDGAAFTGSSTGCWFKNTAIKKAKIKIKKVSADSSTVMYAGLSVVGTVFSVKNSSGVEVTTITIGDDGTGVTADPLDAGTYTIAEKTPTTGFSLNGAKLTVTLVDSDLGTGIPVVDYSTNSTACTENSTSPCWFKNAVIKGKISLTKTGYEVSESGSASSRNLSGIYFEATNQSDTTLKYTIGPTNSSGAVTSQNMVYGTYKAKEIRQAGSNNNAYKLLEFTFSITSTGDNSSSISVDTNTGSASGSTLLDTIPDDPGMSTIARNSLSSASSPSKDIEISATAGVTDHITCSGLISGAEYKLEGTLWNKDANAQVKVAPSGNTYVTGSSTFTADASGKCNGSTGIDMVLATFDSSAYMGKTLAIKQILFKNNGTTASPDWVRIFVHNNGLTIADEEVKVKNIEITTVANSERSANNKQLAAGTVKILDTYNIKGLVNGQAYTLKGYVKDGTTTVATATDNFTMNLATGTTYSNVMTFTFDSTPYVGKSLTVVQELYLSGATTPIATHSTDDGTETVTVITPTLGTSAVNNNNTSSKELEVGLVDATNGSPTIKDTVTYTGLVSGNTYTIKGEVWKIDGSGNAVSRVATKSHSFTASSENSTTGETLTFEVDTVNNCAVNNKLTLPCKFVVYEYIYYANNSSPFAKHEDANDTNQIVSVKDPAITTAASDIQNDTKSLPLGTTTVMDKVTYTNLIAGQTYILKGKLIDLSNGNVVTNSAGTEVTATESFVAAASSASITIDSFKTFDTVLHYDYGLGSNQKRYVVYQTLYSGNIELHSHADNNDAGQIVQIGIPRMITAATYKLDGSNLLGVGDVTMKDYVDYEGLVEGEWYMIVGTMVDPDTGTPVEINDEFVRNTKTFKAGTKGKGTVELEINLNTIPLQGRKFVVYERLYRSNDKHGDGRLLAVHEPAVDEDNQTISVKVASIATVASDKADGDNVLNHETGQVIVDKVHYDGLLMDEDYVLYGYLYDKTNHAPLKDANGNLITASSAFTTPTKKDNGDIEMEFNVNAHDIPGVEIVVFEYLFHGTTVPTNTDGTVDFEQIVTKHADEDNPDPVQTVRVSMRVGTEAADVYDGDQTVGVGKVKVIDKLKYEGAATGKTYKAKGWLVYKAAGKDMVNGNHTAGSIAYTPVITCTESVAEETGSTEGEEETTGEEEPTEEEPTQTQECTRDWAEIKGETTFTIGTTGYENTSGTVSITFELDSRELIGQKLVVFEELYLVDDEGREELVAEHKDLNDDDQTITVATPTVRTIAVDKSDKDKELANDTDVIIVDTVEYTGLAAGTTYTLHGVLVDKNTGERISGGVTEVTWTFTPNRDSGTEEIEFSINTTGMSGKEIVVFETLYIDEEVEEINKIAEHKDLNDDSQTVWVKVTKPNTGLFTHGMEDARKTSLYVVVGVITVLAVGGWFAARYVKHNKIHRF